MENELGEVNQWKGLAKLHGGRPKDEVKDGKFSHVATKLVGNVFWRAYLLIYEGDFLIKNPQVRDNLYKRNEIGM